MGQSNEAARVSVEWALVPRGSVLHCFALPIAQSCVALRCDDMELASGDSCCLFCWWSGRGSCAAVDAAQRCRFGCRRRACRHRRQTRAAKRTLYFFDVAFFFPVDIRRGRVKTPHGAFSNSGSPSPRPERQGQAAGPQWRQRASRVAEGPCGGPCAASAGVAPGRVRVTRCERQADRPTGRPTSRQTYSNIILAGRQAGRPTVRQRGRQTDRPTGKRAGRQTGRPTGEGRPTDGATDRPTDRRGDGPTGRHTVCMHTGNQ